MKSDMVAFIYKKQNDLLEHFFEELQNLFLYAVLKKEIWFKLNILDF